MYIARQAIYDRALKVCGYELQYRKGELYPIYKIITVYETGDWEETEKISKDIGIDEKDIFNDYLYSVKWTREIMEKLK